MIKLKRAYDQVSPEDGYRILVDRLWPRGVSKTTARIDRWEKALAPSTELRKWFDHDPAKWEQFKHRYAAELESQTEAIANLAEEARKRTVTLVYAARDEVHNDAVALRELLERLDSA